MNNLTPVAPYKEIVFKGRTYKRTGISPARAAMGKKVVTLSPGEPGTDDNPIIRNGIPYVYNDSGKLVMLLEFNPETMDMFVLNSNCLTEEQIAMIHKASEMTVVYDDDCPKSTPEQLERFRRYGIERNKEKRALQKMQ